MPHLKLIATTAFGIESVVAHELKRLGYDDLKTSDGKVEFSGDWTDIPRCNLWLRSADRVLLKMAEFRAMDFEELYQGARAIPWEELVHQNGKMHVTGKSISSTLFSVPDCQSIVKRAVVDAMKRKYHTEWFAEDGPVYKIEIALLKDIATLTVDTSGAGLHKRGYREAGGEAPLRETLAAAIIQISRWRGDQVLADPFCGSGTIPIEAALIGRNIAPGIRRSFAAEEWDIIPKKVWQTCREEARDCIKKEPLGILASDIDKRVFGVATENAKIAGVEGDILYQRKPVAEFSTKKRGGFIITNPPYGERISDKEEAERLYAELGTVYRNLDQWSCFVLTPHPEFHKHFGMRSQKNRKLYNGKIKCYLHQFFGDKG